MKVNTDKTTTTSQASNLPAQEAKKNQETGSNSVAVAQNVTNTGSKQIAQQGLSVMNLQATVTRTDLQKQFEENALIGNGKLDHAAADRLLQGNQLANELTQKRPFDLVQNGTQNGNVAVRPGLDQNEQLPGLDNHSRNDQNLKSIFQDAMSGKSPSQQVGSTLIDGAKTPSHNLGEGSLLGATDTPGFKDPTDLSNFPNSKLGVSRDKVFDLGNGIFIVKKNEHRIEINGDNKLTIEGGKNDKVKGVSVDDKNGQNYTFVIDRNDGGKPFVARLPKGDLTPEQVVKTWEAIRKETGLKSEKIGEAVAILNGTLNGSIEEDEEVEDLFPKNDTKKRPADDVTNERAQAGPPPSTTPYNNLVDNEFTTFDSTGVDKYLRLAKGIQNTKVNPAPEGNEGSQGGPAPNEPVPGSGVVDPPDRPVQPTKGPIPVTGPIRRTPGGIPC